MTSSPPAPPDANDQLSPIRSSRPRVVPLTLTKQGLPVEPIVPAGADMRPGLFRKVTNLDLVGRTVQLAVAEELAPLAARGYMAKRNSTTSPHITAADVNAAWSERRAVTRSSPRRPRQH